MMSTLGCVAAVVIALFLPSVPRPEPAAAAPSAPNRGAVGAGFSLLFTIGVLDTGVRMGFLTFLPFLLEAKGASLPMVGTALALVFMGGAAGKFACGLLGARMGVVGTVLATEGGTAVCIIAVMFCPLALAMVLLPLLGAMLNGTSSVLYGTVPELAPPDGTERAFALFYTGTIGSGAIAPVIYGFLGDQIGIIGATFATALTALVIIPLAIALRRFLG
jgi:predicted MFS family arabinose efflux permease